MKKTSIHSAISACVLVPALALAGGHGEKPDAAPWTHQSLNQTLNDMPQGNVERGQTVHTQMMCASCHGENGQSPSRNFSSLNGQTPEYTMKMMLDYRDARRWEDYGQANIMVKLAQAMSDQEIADVAAFYADQSLSDWEIQQNLSDERFKMADRLVRKGDASRLLVPCSSCHGVNGQGNGITPALAGQVPEYFQRTMQAYKDGERHNDVSQGMSQLAKPLTDAEIEALAQYYANLEGS
ncbi:MAG: c-type cytochrome [Hydrogenovibrio sp.]|uniref:c-type cytochrome n=1 Tax=Hydrogenovibrio sp. TaxID=2065821 RepID=UPI002870579B|nr:c-type cytochrome [Hydrogenovibrio sp.]MDR9499469.1 c-type cytochrome [Hydrogenovibrio sp.]